MQILMLSNRYSPDARKTAKELPWRLAEQFVKMGHNVRMIVPGAGDLSSAEPALALRLTPVEIKENNENISYTRFDTRTTSGIDVSVLKPKSSSPTALQKNALGKAAAELLSTTEFKPEILVVWDDTFTPSAGLLHCPLKIAAFTNVPDSLTELDVFDRIVIHGRILAQAIATGNSPLSYIVSSGRAAVYPLCSDTSRISTQYKESAKASIQNTIGLPVEPQIPLIYIKSAGAARRIVLEKLLTQQVQIICAQSSKDEPVDSLSNTYPDRLSVVPPHSNDTAIINGSDFCVLSNNTDEITQALCASTVPIVETNDISHVVEIDPGLKSGNGLSFAPGDEQAETTILHAIGLYHQPRLFYPFRNRISDSIASIEFVAGQYLPTD